MILFQTFIKQGKVTLEQMGDVFVVTHIFNVKAKICCSTIEKFDRLDNALDKINAIYRSELWKLL